MKIGTLCYIENDNKTLMLHRVKKENDIHKDKWIGLGGKIENGETPEECIMREVKEESGLIISNPKLRGVMTFTNFDDEDWYVFLYTTSEFTGEIKESNEGELEWIENDKIFELNISEGAEFFLGWLRESKMFSAKFVYKDNVLVDYHKIDYE